MNSNASTPHPSIRVLLEPMGRTINETRKIATRSVATAKTTRMVARQRRESGSVELVNIDPPSFRLRSHSFLLTSTSFA